MQSILFVLMLCGIVLGQKVYENNYFNSKYTEPAGWAMETPQLSDTNGISFKTTRVGLQPVTIGFYKFSTNNEATLARGSFCFNFMKSFYDGTGSTQSPSLTDINDTASEPSGIGYSSIYIKQVDKSTIMVLLTASHKTILQIMWYVTTVQDFTTNSSLYFMNWESTAFISVLPTRSAKNSATTQLQEKKIIFDLLGRRRDGASAPRARIPLIFKR